MAEVVEGEPFGRWLRRARVENDQTQKDLSRASGISQTYISDIERSASTETPVTPKRETVAQLARGLGVPVKVAEKAAGYLPRPAVTFRPHPDRFEVEGGEVLHIGGRTDEEGEELYVSEAVKELLRNLAREQAVTRKKAEEINK